MPKHCCIENCRRQQDTPGCLKLNFFRVPKDQTKREKWKNSIDDHFHSKIVFRDYTYVCALHFDRKCFNTMGQRITLKRDAFPTIFSNYEDINPNQDDFPEAESSNSKIEKSTQMEVQSISMHGSNDPKLLHGCDKEKFPTMDINDFKNSVNILKSNSQESHDKSSLSLKEQSWSDNEQYSKKEKTDRRFCDSYAEKLFQKSLVNIDIDSINLNNKPLILKLLKNAQKEIRDLRKSSIAKSSKLYRSRKKCKYFSSLLSHHKEERFMTEKELDTLVIRTNKILSQD